MTYFNPRFFIASLLLLSTVVTVNAQTFEWAVKVGQVPTSSLNNLDTEGIAVDSGGNNYFVGSSDADTFIFANDTVTTNFGFYSRLNNMVVGKHSPAGTPVWGYSPSPLNDGVSGEDIAYYRGHLYVTGSFSDTVAFSNNDTLIENISEGSAFILKLDTAGNVNWVTKKDSIQSNCIAVQDSSVVIAGQKRDYGSTDTFNHFFAKYDTAGNFKKAISSKSKSFSDRYHDVSDVGIDSNGNIIGGGEFRDSLTFGNTQIKKFSGLSNDYDGYLVKFDSNLNTQWMERLGNGSAGNNEGVIDVYMKENGSFYATGEYEDSLLYRSNGYSGKGSGSSGFIGEFQSNGTLNWLTRITTSSSGNASGEGLSASSGTIFLTGYFNDSKAFFGNKTVQDSAGGSNVFISKLDTQGDFEYIYNTYHSSGFGDIDVGVDSNKAGYITDGYYGNVTFGNKSLPTVGGGYVTKLSNVQINLDSLKSTQFCPGDSIDLSFTVTNDLYSGNTFTAELSSDSGDFSNPVEMGSVKDSTTDTIKTVIPKTIDPGNGYLVRVVSDNPRVESLPSDSITITGPSSSISTSYTSLCYGDSVKPTVTTSADSFNWSPGGAVSDSTIKEPWLKPIPTNNFQLTVYDSNGCPNQETVNVNKKKKAPLTNKSSIFKRFGDSLSDEARAVTSTCDGGLIVAMSTQSYGFPNNNNFGFLKIKPNGDVEWMTVLEGNNIDDNIQDIIETQKGNFVAVGENSKGGAGKNGTGFLAKLNSKGDTLWTKSFGSNSAESVNALIQANDGNLLVLGNSQKYGAKTGASFANLPWLTKFNQNGNLLWSKHYKELNKEVFREEDIIQTANDTLYLLARSGLLKLDSQGNIVWGKMLNNSGSYEQIDETPNGNLILLGGSGGFVGIDVLKLDSKGNKIWNKEIGAGSFLNSICDGSTVKSLSSGNILIGGAIDNSNYSNEGYLVLLNSGGNKLWESSVGGNFSSSDVLFNDLAIGDSGKFIAVGNTQKYSSKRSQFVNDVIVVKTDTSSGQCKNTPNVSVSNNTLSISNRNDSLINDTPNIASGVKTKDVIPSGYEFCPLLNADFDYENTCTGLPTQFYDSTFTDSLPNYSWDWQFNDPNATGDTSNAQNPSYQFSQADTFNVQLIASNGFDSDTVTKSVIIEQPFNFNIETGDTSFCPPDSIQLQVSDTTKSSYNWSPGNMVSDSTIPEPYAFPSESGTLKVTVTDSTGCQNTDSVNVKKDAKAPLANKNSLFKRIGDSAIDKAQTVTATCDGGIVIGGQTESYGFSSKDPFLMKMNQNGTVDWMQVIEGANSSFAEFTDVIETDRGNILGVANEVKSSSDKGFIVKLDAKGDTLWTRSFGNNQFERSKSLIQLNDGSFLVGGISEKYQNSCLNANCENPWLTKFDKQGNVQWGKHYNDTTLSEFDRAPGLVQTKNDTIYLLGDYHILKTDNKGNQVWFKEFSKQSNLESIDITPGGDLVIGGSSTGFPRDFRVFKVKPNGTLQWAKEIQSSGFLSNDQGNAIKALKDSNILIVGRSEYNTANSEEAYMALLDPNGNKIWETGIGGNKSFSTDELFGLTVTDSNKFIAVGETESFTKNKSDITVIKTDTSGNSECTNNPNLSLSNLSGVSLNSLNDSVITDTPSVSSGTKVKKAIPFETEFCPLFDADFVYKDTCKGVATKFYDSTFQDSLAGYTWDWQFNDPNATGDTSNAQNPSYQFSQADTFNVQLIASNGFDSDTVTKSVIIEQPFNFNIQTADTTLCPNDSIQLKVSDTTKNSYNWSPGTLVSDSTKPEPYAYPSTSDTLQVTVKDSSGCQSVDKVFISSQSDTSLPAPNLETMTYQDFNSHQLNWDTLTTAFRFEQYNIYRRQGYSGPFNLIDSIEQFDSTQWTDPNAPNADSQVYTYFVRAVNKCGSPGLSSDSLRSMVLKDSMIFDKKLQLLWNTTTFNADSLKYELLYDKGSGFSLEVTTFQDTFYNRIACDNSGQFKVRAIDTVKNDTVVSNVIDSSLKDTTAAPAPILSASHFGINQEDQYRVTIGSSDSGDLDKSILFRSVNGKPYTTLDTVGGGIISTFSSSSYPDSQNVCYRIQTIDSCGNLSDTSARHCLANVSATPGNFKSNLYWKPYEGFNADTVEVQRYTSGTWQNLAYLNGSDTSYTDKSLSCKKSYFYRVKYYEAGGNDQTSLSDSVRVTPFDKISPDKPKIHQVTVLNDSTTELSWAPSSGDVNRYVVYRDDASNNFNAIDTLFGRADTNYTDSLNNAIDRSYCYKVKAIDSCADNQSPLSEQHCTIYVTSDTTGCQQQINLSWNGYQGFDSIEQYEIYRQKEGGSRNFLATVDSSVTSYVDSQVDFNFSYTYDIKALAKNSAFTSSSNDTTNRTFAPNTPFFQSASKLTTYPNTGKVKINWNNQQSEPKLAYQKLYYKAPDSTNFDLLKDTIPLSQDTFIHDSLNTKFKDHRYYLTTVDNCGNESDSARIHKTMELEFDVGQLLHDLSWTPYEGWPVARYEVQRKQGGVFKTLDTLAGDDTAIEKRPEPCNFPISYRIKAVDSQGNFAYSDTGINKAIDTVNPDAAAITNASIENDSIAQIRFIGADSLDIFSYDVMRKQGNGNYQLAERVIFDSAGGKFMVYDTTNTIQGPLCYKVLTQDSCLNTVSSDSFCANYLKGNPQNLSSGLSWQKFDGYPIDSQYVLKFNGTNHDTLARLGGNDTAYEDTGLRCNRPYRYKVLSFEQGGSRTTKSNPRTVIPFDTVPPAAPDFRQATVGNSDSITIKWDTSADIDVDRYEIFYAKRGDSFTSAGIVTKQNRQLNTFTHDTSAIDPLSESYCYYVEAIDSCSDVHSMPSDTHCVIELQALGGQRESHLTWQGYEGIGINRYLVERKETSSWEIIDTVPGTDTAYTDSNNARCTISYDYRVRAEWNDGMSFTSKSDTAEAMPFDTVNPEAPYIEAFSGKGPDSAEINWQLSNGDVKQYEVWLKTQNAAWQNRDTVGVQTSYTFSGLNTLDSQYCTRIVAIDSCAANRSPFSTVHCAPQLSGEPGQKENQLNWTAYEGWDSTEAYYIYNQNPKIANWQLIDTVNGTDTSYTHTGIPCNRPQYYRIEGKGDNGFTAFSDSIALTPFDTISPDAPAINYVTVKNPDAIEGFFDTAKARDLGEYVVYAKAGTQPYQPIDTIADTGQSFNQFTHIGIRPDTGQYCYRIRSIDSCAGNISGFSNPDCAVELQGNAGNLATNLNWHPYQGFTNPTYLIQRRGNTTSWQTLGSRTDTTFNDTMNLACNVTYTYRVRTVSPSGNDTSYSDTLNLQPFDTTAPPVPQLRFASANLQDEVEVEWQWDRGSAQKYFEIWRDQGNGNYANLDTVTYDSTYLDGSANPGQTPHAYFVRAIDSCAADGTIGAPGKRSIPSDTDRIMVPEVATGACLPEARLSWTPYEALPQGTDYYKIYRQQTATNNAFQQVGTSPDTSFTDTTILDGNEYCYRIEAVDTQSGYTAYSDSLCMQPFVYPIPDTARIKRTTVTKTGQSNGEILVEWEPAPSSDTFARGYYIYHRQNGGSYQLIANISDLGDTTFRHQGINTAKFPHQYRMVIYNLCLEDGGYRKVHRPVKLYGENRNLEVALDWLPYQGFDVQKYEVQRSVNGGPFRSLDTLMNRDTAYRDSSVRCGNLYAYRIYAEGSEGHEQSLSDSIGFVAYDTIPPDRAGINRGTIVETNATNGIAELDFQPATQANRKGYIIYRSEDNSRFVPVDTVFSNSTNTITYSDSNLNTQYSILSYYIRSIDSCDNIAAPSDTHQLINLQTEAKNLANEVNWTAYEGWNDWLYELQRRTPNTNWTTIARQDTGNRAFTDSTKNCDTLYHYRVKAINANTGGVSFSNYDTATSIDQQPPQPPEPERVSVEESGHVLIEWNSSISKDQEFDYLFKKPASNPNFEPQATNLETTNYTDSQSTANDEPISYRLSSEDSCENVSDPSDVHTTIHLTSEPGEEQNELTWTTYEGWDVKSYEVYKDGNQVAELSSDQRSFTDVRAVCTTYHNYRVRAIKDSGEEVFSWSNIDSAQARDNTPPQAVNLTTATVLDPNEVVEVRWEASTAYDADGYELYRSGLNRNGLTPIATIEGAETTRFRDSLSNPVNEQFCYQVRVRDFCGNVSERSNSGCVMSIEGEATEGTNLLNWDNYYEWPGNIAYYEIYKKEDSSFYEQIGRTEETNYSDENLKNLVTDFCYQVEAHHSGGDETSRSFEICLKQPQIVHIPNSFTPGITEGQNDKFGPEGLYFENYEMQIFNRWGEEIFSTESGEPWDGTYEGQPAPVGIYLYSITVTGENGRRESYEGSVNVVR